MYENPHHKGAYRLRKKFHTRWQRFARSGFVTTLGLLVLLAVLGTLWMAHLRGRIHQLTTAQELPEQAAPTVRPGGQELVHLNRFEVAGSIVPEFTAVTLAPGDGMLLLWASLNLPGRGEVPVVLGTREADLPAANNNFVGADFSAKVESREAGHTSAPVELVAGRASSQQNTTVLPGGTRAEARFSPDVDGAAGMVHTGVEATVSSVLTGRGLVLSLSARNTSGTPRGITLQWQPRFLAPQAGMQAMSVVPPLQTFNAASKPAEQPLGVRDFDETYTSLQHSYLSAGPEVRLRNQADGYTLRLTALTPGIRSVRLRAMRQDSAVLVAFSTANGSKPDDMRTVIAPGESLEWRIRIEAVPNSAPAVPIN